MKISSTVQNAQIISKVSTPSKDESTMYHSLGIMTATGEVGMLKASSDVIDMMDQKKITFPYPCNVVCEYNDKYDTFRVTGLVATKA